MLYRYYEYISDEIERLKNIPDTNEEKIKINPGDWVTTNLNYAKSHGKSNLNNQYRILTKIVPAKHLYNDGNSIHEFGYDP
jgi:translation initiation factor IF-1